MKIDIPSCPNWQQQRQQRWDDLWWDSLTVHGCTPTKAEKETVAAQEQWYVNGSLEPLMALPNHPNKEDALALFNVLQLAPITDPDIYVEFLGEYCRWLSEEKIGLWGAQKPRRDEFFIRSGFNRFLSAHTDTSQAVHERMLKMLLPGDDGVTRLPLKLGLDQWQPQSEVALCDVSLSVFIDFTRHLFADDGNEYSHVCVALQWIKWLKDLDPKYFSLVLLGGKFKLPPKPPTPKVPGKAGQQLIRHGIGSLLGYKNSMHAYDGPLRHNNPEFEEQLRCFIDSLDMPEEYYRLVEFIHAHPDDYCERSVEE